VSVALAPTGLAEAAGNAEHRSIPFDYLFTFSLQGKPGRTVSETVTVSVEGPFITRAIGYGMIAQTPRFFFGLPRASLPTMTLGDIVDSLKQKAVSRRGLNLVAKRKVLPLTKVPLAVPLVETVLRTGFRLNPDLSDIALNELLEGKAPKLSDDALANLFEATAIPPEQVQFRYALFDQGSGRAFQSDPILNTAGLGISDGTRPFRELWPPIRFAPRTTIRMDVVELSQHSGTLYVALHGYKVLGETGAPTDTRRLRRRARR